MRQDQAESQAQQLQQDSARDEIYRLRSLLLKPYGLPSTLHTASTSAKWDVLTRVDPGTSTLVVTLPPLDPKRRGELIAVKHEGSSGLVTVTGATNETIDGATSQTLRPGDLGKYIAAESGKWIQEGQHQPAPWTVTDVKTAAYTADWWEIVRGATGSGGFTVTLPPASADRIGEMVCVKKVSADGNTLAVAPSGSDVLTETSPYSQDQNYHSVCYCCDTSASWIIVWDFFEEGLMG